MKKFSAQTGIVHVIPLLIVLVIAGVVIWFFINKGGLEPKGTTVPITPSRLMPSVSATQARGTICNMKKEGLFTEACQEKFNIVGKDDKEKLAELFGLIKKIKNDKSLSDYDRLLLSQAVFAALPNKDSPQESPQRVNFYRLPSLIKTVFAQDGLINEEELKKLMKEDLQNVLNIPKGDNAWVISVTVARYSWKDGVRQPAYFDDYGESRNPYPNNPNVDEGTLPYNVRSVVGELSLNEGGDSIQVAWSFQIQSWKSEKFAGYVEKEFITSRSDKSDANYRNTGNPFYLTTLLEEVKFPTESDEPDAEPTNQTQGVKVDCSKISSTLKFEGEGKVDGSGPNSLCKSIDKEKISRTTHVTYWGGISLGLSKLDYDPAKPISTRGAPTRSQDLDVGDEAKIHFWEEPWDPISGKDFKVFYMIRLGNCAIDLEASAVGNVDEFYTTGAKPDWKIAGEYITQKLTSVAKEIEENISTECGAL
ncbi:hypothetical protein A2631_00760 [Candidatus Daviesbacteria bacterium RIFCSPHIGHO2_01_FULL_44_29]|uniref:Uncharacterized protein n=1 Tax=Candidatus Daviesbacteria bacterium RIFCSPHIGHO2_02_FULL_43_12 TaxID=1797776 RepID=A0A1F5KI12_9BACT|nr:MAG: hypothetical protein A2631_00760 [Candidatus Daviesbacteria bacterium RIFCSPHIGHO2_01_FULL_44_29]OGE39372.1 MAG: hypothetical protein A3E86_01620 [Candidatus Daviesbacteria bacterium RIFCSPHIGHO2_12_FULL_47_45]OGE40251.1 MAG: hypothetical protein A3D25_05225 [Candidatus Daviesbacteria bacterium RIFCSPHIGHO2_02_FULL_43_12]OGE69050.1 MAG: hypothetical protein A3B55_02305 [Candidatus Daviesbacteria bacterium RIFCSPLOWO2_01_FULL_43_15]